jgi:hypothetical protein
LQHVQLKPHFLLLLPLLLVELATVLSWEQQQQALQQR